MTIARLSEVSLEYFEQGEGPNVVVFVHGYQASARVWHGVQQALPAQQYRSIAINNRGAGATEAPPNESDFTIQKFAADAFELVTQLGLPRFTLVGHSMGGATVAQFAVDHPELVSGLVLLDPARNARWSGRSRPRSAHGPARAAGARQRRHRCARQHRLRS
jgi:pimeloyl-ACP methyl ester carboxylesterase